MPIILVVILVIMGLVYSIPFFIMYAITKEKIMPQIRQCQDRYIKKIARDIKKYAIPEELIEKGFNFTPDVSEPFWTGFWFCLVVGAIITIVVALNNPNSLGLALLSGFIPAIPGSFVSAGMAGDNIEAQTNQELEKLRCPHCGAPLSYRVDRSYDSGEEHYLRRKTRSENGITWQENVPITSYVHHRIYKCAICKTEEETTEHREHEERDIGSEISASIDSSMHNLTHNHHSSHWMQ